MSKTASGMFEEGGGAYIWNVYKYNVHTVQSSMKKTNDRPSESISISCGNGLYQEKFLLCSWITKNTLSKYLETIFAAQWQIHTAVLSTRTIRGMVRFHFCFTNEITKQCYACCFMYRDNFVPHGICFSASGWKCQKVWLLSWLLFRFLLKC